MSDTPTFSIVIPTRDRPGTLPSSLRTAVAAADDDTEIVVHDNSTTDAVAGIVEALGDGRVRHVRVHDLAMTENWEAAVRSARGRWITVLGDDDGLMPFAVRAARRTIVATGADVIAWRKARYCWPDRDRDANKLKVPAARPAVWVEGRRQLELVLADPRHRYGDLPMLYNAFVSRAALDRIRRADGRILASRSPDVYSGAAVAATTERFVRVGIPFSVNGLSGASNGVNTLTKPAGTAVANDFATLNARAGIAIHAAVPDIRSLAGAALESCLTALDAFAPDLDVDRVDIIRSTLADAVLFSDEEVQQARDLARRSVAGRPTLERRVERLLRRWVPRPAPQVVARDGIVARIGPDAIQVDAARFGITDVAAATRFAAACFDEADESIVPAPVADVRFGPRLRRAAGLARDALRTTS